MIIFSKNNYKYFIGFLIAFILIVLVYGNYNLKINIIETLNCDKSTGVENCIKPNEKIETTSELSAKEKATNSQREAERTSMQLSSDANSLKQ